MVRMVLVFWGVSVAGGCGGARGSTVAPVAGDGDAGVKRHPDGVVVEPPPAVPSAGLRADARGVVSLREPLGDKAIREVVTALFDGFANEDIEALTRLLTQDAVSLDARGRVSRAQLIEGWRRRLQSQDYARIAGLELVRFERVQRFELDELGGLDEPPRPPEMRVGDVLVRVPVELSRIGGDKLFGETIVLMLRREQGRFRIAGYGESE